MPATGRKCIAVKIGVLLVGLRISNPQRSFVGQRSLKVVDLRFEVAPLHDKVLYPVEGAGKLGYHRDVLGKLAQERFVSLGRVDDRNAVPLTNVEFMNKGLWHIGTSPWPMASYLSPPPEEAARSLTLPTQRGLGAVSG